MNKVQITLIIALLGLFYKVDAQSLKQFNKPLNIGDKIPESIWNQIFSTVNEPGGKTKITLSQYKGKLIILDFWATNCGSCIKAMSNLNAIQKQFKDEICILPISYEKKERAMVGFRKNPLLRNSKLQTVIEDHLLTKLFPHLYISHLVWIDKNGIVRAFTHPDYVSSENIAAMLKNPVVNWPVKRDIIDFDFNQNLFVLNSANIPSFNNTGAVYHSAITPHIENVAYRFLTYSDTAANTFYVRMINLPIREMYLRSMGINDFPISHILVLNNDSERFIWNPQNSYKENWNMKNTFCYEAVLPLNIPVKQRVEKIKADLDFYFGISAEFQDVKTNCLILSEMSNKLNFVNNKINEPELAVTDLVYLLNRTLPTCPVLSEVTNIKTVHLKINKNKFTDLDSLKNKLEQQGLKFIEQQRTISMFVLKPKMH